jgi:hypothetical protein
MRLSCKNRSQLIRVRLGFDQPRIAVASEIIVAPVQRLRVPVVEQTDSIQTSGPTSDDGYAHGNS